MQRSCYVNGRTSDVYMYGLWLWLLLRKLHRAWRFDCKLNIHHCIEKLRWYGCCCHTQIDSDRATREQCYIFEECQFKLLISFCFTLIVISKKNAQNIICRWNTYIVLTMLVICLWFSLHNYAEVTELILNK